MRRRQTGFQIRPKIVPLLEHSDDDNASITSLNRSDNLCRTALTTEPYGTVYLCRRVYDFKRKRIIKNPRPDSLLFSGIKQELDSSPMDLSLGRTSRASLRRECTKRKMFENSDSNSSHGSNSSTKRKSTERSNDVAKSLSNTVGLMKAAIKQTVKNNTNNNNNTGSNASNSVNNPLVSQPIITPMSSTTVAGHTVAQTAQFQITGGPRGFHTLPFSLIPQTVGPIRQRTCGSTPQRFGVHHLPFMLLQPRILSTVPQRALLRAAGAITSTSVPSNTAQLTTLIQQQAAVLQAQNAAIRAAQFPVVLSNTQAAVPLVTSVPMLSSKIASGTAAVTDKNGPPEPAQSPGEGETATGKSVISSCADSATTALDLTMTSDSKGIIDNGLENV